LATRLVAPAREWCPGRLEIRSSGQNGQGFGRLSRRARASTRALFRASPTALILKPRLVASSSTWWPAWRKWNVNC